MSIKNRQYQIIATLGPAVKNKIEALIQAGATGFRLNCSHLSWEQLSRWLIELEQAFKKRGNAMPVWLDLQGTKKRIGKLSRAMNVNRGDRLVFKNSYQQIKDEVPLPHQCIFDNINVGDEILLDDGKIRLTVTDIELTTFQTESINSGELNSFKGFVLKNYEPELSEVSDRDRSFIEQTQELKFVGYAVSYLQSADELRLFREIASHKAFAAKIEQKKAFKNLKEIAEIANMSWLCRGDLGANSEIFDLYNYEKEFASQMMMTNKPYLIAGQVLENMVTNSEPSRSEIAHLGFLIEHGFAGLVLSDETAIGKYPVQAVEFCREYFNYLMS